MLPLPLPPCRLLLPAAAPILPPSIRRRHRWPDSCAIHLPSLPPSLPPSLSLALYDTDGLRQIRSTDGGGRVAAIPELNFYGREGIRFRGSCPKCGLPLKKRKERRARGITERRPRVCLADASGTFQRVLVQETRLAGMNPILRPFYDFASNCLVEGSDERANDDKARHHLPRVGRACSRPTRSRSAARSLARFQSFGSVAAIPTDEHKTGPTNDNRVIAQFGPHTSLFVCYVVRRIWDFHPSMFFTGSLEQKISSAHSFILCLCPQDQDFLPL